VSDCRCDAPPSEGSRKARDRLKFSDILDDSGSSGIVSDTALRTNNRGPALLHTQRSRRDTPYL